MTLQEFITEWNGKKNNFDGVYDHQCVDIVKQYIQDVLNIAPWTGEPKNYGSLANRSYFSYHSNDPLYIPPKGSIAIWNGFVGDGHGHVAIVTSAFLLSFTSFDQNWPTGSECRLVNHNYRNVSGFLIPRQHDAVAMYNGLRSEMTRLLSEFGPLSA